MTIKSERNGTAPRWQTTTMKRRKRLIINIILITVGTLLVSTGVAIIFTFDSFFEMMLKDALTFNAESIAYSAWQKNDPPLPMNIYLFNWTNVHEVNKPGVKPKFKQFGPYRFREAREKINITWSDNNDTVSYRHKKFYYINEDEEGAGNLSDVVTIVNMVPLTLAYRNRFSGSWTKMGLTLPLMSSSLAVTSTVREILFDGYFDNLLTMAGILPFTNVQDKFGYFYGRNGTEGSDGSFSMWTRNDENFGKIRTWNNRTNTGFYKGQCGDIKGSAGEFHPLNRKRDAIYLYSPELCKSGRLTYERDVEVLGVKGYKYGSRHLFDNGTLLPENSCFCNGECIPTGVLNVSKCRENAPIFLSLPHFYNADPYYLSLVEGLHPEEDKHDFYMTLEPKTGITFDVAARMQLNVLLQPIKGISMYSSVPRAFVPVFYFDQKLPVKVDLASQLKMLQQVPSIANIASVIFISLGLLCFLWVLISCLCCSSRYKYPDDYKLSQNKYEDIPLRS